MNWFKLAQVSVKFLSYNSYGEFEVLIGDKPYTYYDISPYIANKLKWMIENLPVGVALKQLKHYSDPDRYRQLNNQKTERDEIMDELYERGILK